MVEQERIDQQPDNKHGETHDRPQNRRARLRTWVRVRSRWIRIRRWQVARWATLILVVVSGLVFVSRYVSGDTDPIQFVTGNLLNVLIFAAIVAQVLIYRKQRDIMRHQWKSMQGQLDAMESQSTAIKIQAQAALEAVATGKDQLLAMQGQWKAMDESLEETRKLVAQNERAVKAAEDNVETVEKTAIYASRAYVAATIAQIDEVYRLHLYVANSGNTPANDVRVAYSAELRNTPPVEKVDGQVASDGGYTRYEALGMIPPRDGRTFIAGGRGSFTHEELKLWKANRVRFYCWGTVLYEDIFNAKRVTWFCFYQSYAYPQGQTHEYGNLAI